MKKILAVVCAMKSEAQPLIDKIGEMALTEEAGFLLYHKEYENTKLIIGISGVGMVNMAALVTYLSVKYNVDYVFNYGIIGGYGDKIHKGDLLAVMDCININSTIYDAAPKGAGISLDRSTLTTFSENIDNSPVVYKSCAKLMDIVKNIAPENTVYGRLGSGDVWNKEYDKIMLFHSQYDVMGEDMEGYAMYQVADRFNIPAISLKGVSNNEILSESYDYSVMEKLSTLAFDFVEKIVKQ